MLRDNLISVKENIKKAAMKAETAITVVMVSGGYPESYKKGFEITGIENVTESTVFHAGTKLANGQIVTNGGRVLGVTARGKDIAAAVQNAYKAVACISWGGMQYRKDIAHRALERR